MQIASWLLVTSTLIAAPAPRPSTNDTAVTADQTAQHTNFAAQQRATIAATPANSSPVYRFGLGGNIVVSNYGIGASSRYWFTKHIGVAGLASWSPARRYNQYSYLTGSTQTFETSSTISASPSVMFMLNQTDENREVSLRPYFGIGAGYIHATRGTAPIITGPTGTTVTYSGMTEHAYGGAEMMFRDYPNLAISGELIYYNIPNTFLNRIYMDGLNFQIAAHFYIK